MEKEDYLEKEYYPTIFSKIEKWKEELAKLPSNNRSKRQTISYFLEQLERACPLWEVVGNVEWYRNRLNIIEDLEEHIILGEVSKNGRRKK